MIGGIVQTVAWGFGDPGEKWDRLRQGGPGAAALAGWGADVWSDAGKPCTLFTRDTQKSRSFFFLWMCLSRNRNSDVHFVTILSTCVRFVGDCVRANLGPHAGRWGHGKAGVTERDGQCWEHLLLGSGWEAGFLTPAPNPRGPGYFLPSCL